MTIPTEVIMRMATLGLTQEQAKAVADMLTAVETATAETYEATMEASREKARQRVAKWRANNPSNVTKRNETSRNHSRGRDTRVEDKTSNSEIEPQKKDIRDTPLSRLEVVLDQERARSVVDHRQRIRKPLTERAAKLLADKFARCRDPNAAADAMVSNGWQGFEPEWMDRPTARGSPAVVPMKDTAANAARRRIEAIENARRQSGFGALDDHQPAAGVLSIDFRRAGG